MGPSIAIARCGTQPSACSFSAAWSACRRGRAARLLRHRDSRETSVRRQGTRRDSRLGCTGPAGDRALPASSAIARRGVCTVSSSTGRRTMWRSASRKRRVRAAACSQDWTRDPRSALRHWPKQLLRDTRRRTRPARMEKALPELLARISSQEPTRRFAPTPTPPRPWPRERARTRQRGAQSEYCTIRSPIDVPRKDPDQMGTSLRRTIPSLW